MKKYLVLSFLFLLVTVPVLAKSANSNSVSTSQDQNQVVITATPSGNQAQTQNLGQAKKLVTPAPENEPLDQTVDENITKVSTQVQELIDTVGAKSGIGQQVKVIAQNQQQTQEKIKSSYYQLKNRGQLVRLFVGSDKKMTKALEQMTEENKAIIQKLEEMKNLTKDQADLDQLQKTIDSLLYQNTSLGEKIAKEKQVNGLFGWFVKLFNKE